MICFKNGGILCEFVNELPKISHDNYILYGDFETTSRDSKLDSINPWKHCWPIGFAMTYDDDPRAWFIPFSLFDKSYLQNLMSRAAQWVNHHIKYDMHVLKNCTDVDPCHTVVCTVARAKLLDSQQKYKGGYSLDTLSELWLDKDISHYEELFKPYLTNNKDYGNIPLDLMAEYACQDVLTTRELDKYLDGNLPDDALNVADTEIAVTTILYEIERNGIRVDVKELRKTELDTYEEMVKLDAQLTELVGRPFNPGSSADCFDVLCNQYGMPVMGWTEANNASFDKDTLKKYRAHPGTPTEVVEGIIKYRALDSFNSKYTRPFQEHQINNVIHCNYNQTVETGRSSCSEPSMHQNNKFSKGLIHPAPGWCFISVDLSQIEFRMIVHYIQNRQCTEAYLADPDTDFHKWTAQQCGIKRKPAKTVNFMMGYGGGKKKLVATLSRDADIVSAFMDHVKDLDEADRNKAFEILAEARATEVYDTYHRTLPELKRVSNDVARVVRQRGYCRNMYGRRRYLQREWAHIGFNSLCQSSAADLFKKMLVGVDDFIKPTRVQMVAQVHDEILLHAPLYYASDIEFLSKLVHIMETPEIPLRVPVRASIGMSDVNWREASESGASWPYKIEHSYPDAEGKPSGFSESRLCMALVQ